MATKRREAAVARRLPGEVPVPRPTSEGVRQALAKTFLQRSVKTLQRISDAASSEALTFALSSPSDVGGLATLLSDLAPLGLDVSPIDPFAEAIARGAEVKRDLLERSGGVLNSSQVAQALGITRQSVDKRRLRRKLLAVPSGSGDYLYPVCQFTPEGVIAGFEQVLGAFGVDSPWTQLSLLLNPSPALGGRSVLDAVRAGDADRAAAVASAFGEQGA